MRSAILNMDSWSFVAGAENSQTTARATAERWLTIEAADFVFGWAPDAENTPQWWADIAYAISVGTRAVVAEPSMDFVLDPAMSAVKRACGTWLNLAGGKDEALELAAACVFHDPKRELERTNDGRALFELLRACESQSVQRLALHLRILLEEKSSYRIRAQHPVLGGRYQIDLAIDEPGGRRWAKVCVECDGNGGHERNRQQVARDKARARAIANEGWRIIRFARSEIWREPGKCAREVATLLDARVAEGA